MSASPIHYYDRASGELKTETIYGEGWLRFAYENPVGRLLTWAVFRRAFFSHWYGWRMSQRYSASKVLPFVVDYDLDAEEFVKPAWEFKTFNDFFYRELKAEARPIATGDDVAVFPADGRHLVIPNVDTSPGFFVKGLTFDLKSLLDDEALAAEFAGGSMVISRLCPVDYHRFHFPVTGVPGEAELIKGRLYSVSPIALRRRVRYLVENKRMRTMVQTENYGRVVLLEVGATCVGSIRNFYVPDRVAPKGEEKGFFKFGGSCVITLFAPGRIEFDADLVKNSARQVETYAKMGERMGQLLG